MAFTELASLFLKRVIRLVPNVRASNKHYQSE